jgi:hypothetical protein
VSIVRYASILHMEVEQRLLRELRGYERGILRRNMVKSIG